MHVLGLLRNGLSRTATPASGSAATVPVDGDPRAITAPALVVYEQGTLTRVQTLLDGPIVLGRSESCAISLPDRNVSRLHCEFGIDRGRVVVTDLGSTNGTHLYGRRVGSEPLMNGDEVAVGQSLVKLIDAGGEANRPALIARMRHLLLDPASGLLNGRGFRARLDAWLVLCDADTMASLVLVDTSGLADEAWASAGIALRTALPPCACAGRLDRDRIAVMLIESDDSDPRCAAGAAESLLATLPKAPAKSPFPTGIARGRIRPSHIRQLFRQAEDSLHEARWRNC
jgi:hypothetical protein